MPQMMSEDENAYRPSLLPFDPADLVAMRVSPAQFSRMCGVSKQSVSQWIKSGKVTIGPDGKMDPSVASRQVFQRSDPGRLRARVFKDAMSGTDELRTRVRSLEQQLADQLAGSEDLAAGTATATRHACFDEQARQLARLQDAIADGLDGMVAARAVGLLSDHLDALIASIFYPESCAPADAVAAEGDTATSTKTE